MVSIDENGVITTLLGNKNGTFTPGPTTSFAANEESLELVADLNGDGKLDLVAIGSLTFSVDPSEVLTYLGNGDGTFMAPQATSVESSVYFGVPGIGDFNGDGILDLAIPSPGGILFLAGLGTGAFAPPQLNAVSWTSPGYSIVADLNGDGRLDLVVTQSAGFSVFFGNGDGTFQPPASYATPKPPADMIGGDVNRDGHIDLVLTLDIATPRVVYFYAGNANGTFSGPTYPDLPTPDFIALGDVNGDGIPDLVNSQAYVALGNGKGSFGRPAYFPTAQGSLVYLADMLNNGSLDIVEANGPFVSVLLNNGKGKFEDGWALPAPEIGCGVAADFNGDGKVDIAADGPTGISLFLGTGRAATPFAAAPGIAVSNAACLATGDFNNDGKPDLLVPVNPTAPQTIGSMVAYLGNGDGTFTQASSTQTPLGFIAVADFNRDGKLDYATNENLLALGNGDGTFQSPAPFVPYVPLGATFAYIATADVNHDGWPDLVLSELPANQIFILTNNHKGGFTETVLPVSDGPFNIVLGDLNGDGNIDMAVGLYALGGVAVLLGNGQGRFIEQEIVPAEYEGIPLIADVNGDGIPDIELAMPGTMAVYLGKGGAQYDAPFYLGTYPSPGSVLALNLHGQPAAAGTPDLVTPDETGYLDVLINETK